VDEHADRQWFIAGRWQEYEGEARANLLRVAGVALFYLIEVWNYRAGGVDRHFHLAATALAAAWAMTSWGVWVCLVRRIFPERMKFLSTAADLLLLTCVLLLADGPRSPLLAGYFVVISLAALRFSLPLVRMAAGGAIVSYLVVIGEAWKFRPALSVPRYHEAIMILALALTGVIVGQVVRRVRGFAEDYARRLSGR
jgi:hypothetical protein